MRRLSGKPGARPTAVPNGLHGGGIGRVLSVLAAIVIVGALFIYPRILGQRIGAVEHTALPLILIGVCAAIIHGVGFRPDSRIARLLLGPIAASAFMTLGLGILALQRLTQ